MPWLFVCLLSSADALHIRPPVMAPEQLKAAIWQKRYLFDTDVHATLRNGEGAPRFRLAYMPMRNRIEIPRLVLEEVRCAYELEVIGFKIWAETPTAGPRLKSQAPFGKLPCLWNYDGLGSHLSQEAAITRFLAQRVGLAGRGAAEAAKVDELYTLLMATLRNNGLTHDGEQFSTAALKELAAGGGRLPLPAPRYEEMFRQNAWPPSERSLAGLRLFEEQLGRCGTGFLTGAEPTYADLALFHVLWELAEPDKVPDFASRFGLPLLGAFLERVAARPQLDEYLHSARRMPRYERDPSGTSLYTYCAGKHSPAQGE